MRNLKNISVLVGCVLGFLSCSSSDEQAAEQPSEEANSNMVTGDENVADAGADSDCTEGERRCDGSSLMLCTNGQWAEPDECATARLCEDTVVLCGISEDACPSGCQPAACDEQETRCAGSVVMECNADRTGFSPGEDCGPVCSRSGGQHCSEGECRRDVCDSAGEFFDTVGDIAECSLDCSEVTYPFAAP